ncbi:uncharacterized protein LOC127135899 [Lathyrus oleraceus]|uniref:uncharacterized protein LOC127135899 n=1 Tax=Pisum sativum TaxID=3888 RepID=UPI0021D26B82|nr:uncharacterized protein LOC127135899 [Pisum sativum]
MHNKGEELTWGAFRQKFLDKYFLGSCRAEKEVQFLRLHHSNMSVIEYVAKFESLAKYSRFFNNVVDEDYKCEPFESLLCYDIKEVVASYETRQYKALVEKCKKVENLKHSRPSRDFVGGPRGTREITTHRTRADNKGLIHDHKEMEEGHKSFDCPTKKIYCYICQKPDHLTNNFPDRNKNNPKNNNNNNQVGRPTAQGRVYHIGGEGEKDHSELINGEREIYGKVFPILFDSRDTHSFISWESVNSLQLPVTHLPFNLVVMISSSEHVTLSEACLQCPLTILNMKFKVDLICITLKHLGVILGMDWLTNNYILLDCARRSVILPDLGVTRFLEANRLKFSLHEDVQKYVFLNSISMSPEVDVIVIPVVRDFSEVFPADVPGLPQICDVEFSIDITHGT